MPQAWEIVALKSFESGAQKETADLHREGTITVFRYMAPLITAQSCLKCHAQPGYRVGDIRGGISVTLPATVQPNWTLVISHVLIALVGSGLIVVLGMRLDRTIRALEAQSNLDGLTQIHNRRYFDESLEREFLASRRRKTRLAIAICDIDHFKAYNEGSNKFNLITPRRSNNHH